MAQNMKATLTEATNQVTRRAELLIKANKLGMRSQHRYFQTSTFFFDLMVLPLFDVVFTLAPFPPFDLVDLLTNLAGFLDSQTFGRIPLLRMNLPPSSDALPVVLAFVWVLCPFEGSPSL
jgi:hypothetical protein